ncbi:MAG: hypothetical protein ABL893_11475, partial [Hyphomicrobium sp.]
RDRNNCKDLSDPGSTGSLRETWIRGAYDWSSDPYAPGSWNSTHKGMQTTGYPGTTWKGPQFAVNPGQNWRIVIRIKSVGTTNSTFYAGVTSYDHTGTEIFTDAMSSYNYHVASGAVLVPGNTYTYAATIGGWNPAGGSGTGFDPDAAFFSPIMILNYTNPATASVVVQGISVFPVQ